MAAELAALCQPPPGRRYGPRELDVLRADLDAVARDTVVVEAVDSAEFRLRPDGTTGTGRRLTETGLRHICRALAPGLFALVENLAGAERTPDDPPEIYSLREAVQIYNSVLARRFGPRIERRYSLVIDARRGTVDGLIGPGHRFLDNARFLEVALAAAREAGRDMVLLEAARGDRRLAVRLVDRGAAATILDPHGHRWRTGLHFANSELGGEQAACGSALLVWPAGKLHALGPAAGGRTVHAGREFEDRLLRALLRIAARPPDRAAIGAAFARLAARPASRDERPATGRRREDPLGQLLRRRGMPGDLADRAAALAAVGGTDDRTPAAELPSRRTAPPSAWDLYRGIAAVAQSLGQPLRERIERVAYACLRLEHR